MKRFIIVISGLLILLAGCRKNGCFESSGPTALSVRAATPFTQIDVYDNISIVLKQDTAEGITIEAGAHLLPYIKTVIANNVLTLRNNSGCSWLRGPTETVTAYISVKTLSRMNFHGSGNVSSVNTLTSPDITLDAWEASSIVKLAIQSQTSNFVIRDENAAYIITGTTGYASLYGGQKGTMRLQGLQAEGVYLDQRSIFDAFVWATVSLTVRVQYKGNVYYKGTPNITYDHYSDGRLIPLQ
ncbi:MAG TPA: DUF2807 domain-containing protein [Chitinophagaceae bacterium]|nr:DUF2807 domain-containing protein [Chitinophagaceae bacterium]